MPSSAIKRLEIAKESSYCNRNSSGVPSTTGLTFAPVEFADAAQVVAVGNTTTTQATASHPGFVTYPGDPLIDPTVDQAVRSGTLTIDFYLRGGLTSSTESQSLLLLFGTRLRRKYESATYAATTTISTAGQPTFGSSVTFPAFFGYNLPDGRVSYGVTTSTGATPAAEPRPSYDSALTTAAIYPGGSGTGYIAGYYVQAGGGEQALDYSTGRYTVALRISGDGWQQVCYGCSLTALTISADGDGRAIKCSCTIDCPCVLDVETPVAGTWPTVSGGPVLHSLGSPAVINAAGSATDFETPQCISQWSLSLAWTTAGAACGTYWQGRAPLEGTNLDAQLTLTIGRDAAESREFFAEAWKNRTPIGLSLPFGGQITSGTNKFGGALVFPAAYVANGDVLIQDVSSDLIQTNVTLGLTGTAAAQALFMLGVF